MEIKRRLEIIILIIFMVGTKLFFIVYLVERNIKYFFSL